VVSKASLGMRIQDLRIFDFKAKDTKKIFQMVIMVNKNGKGCNHSSYYLQLQTFIHPYIAQQ